MALVIETPASHQNLAPPHCFDDASNLPRGNARHEEAIVVLTRVVTSLPLPLFAWLPRRARRALKEHAELAFWRSRAQAEKQLGNSQYEFFYTTLFDLRLADYWGKRVLDVGCGPRGSLEWATMARERVGLDPLVASYKALGIDKHQMIYAGAPSEAIPYPDRHFDIVTSFNSLDHVENLERSISEIARVLRENGRFLLIVKINHPPTATEPVSIEHDVLRARLQMEYEMVSWRTYDLPSDHHICAAVKDGIPRLSAPTGPAILVASFIRRDAWPDDS
jgi:SAM-dependent methyltransferase